MFWSERKGIGVSIETRAFNIGHVNSFAEDRAILRCWFSLISGNLHLASCTSAGVPAANVARGFMERYRR